MHTQEEKTIKKLRNIFWLQAALVAATALLFETGILTKGNITLGPTTRYIADVAGIMLTIACIPLAIKGFSELLERAVKKKKPHFTEYFYTISTARMSILFVATALNTALFYSMNNEGAMYCALLGAGAMVYSYPRREILDDCLQQIKNNDTK